MLVTRFLLEPASRMRCVERMRQERWERTTSYYFFPVLIGFYVAEMFQEKMVEGMYVIVIIIKIMYTLFFTPLISSLIERQVSPTRRFFFQEGGDDEDLSGKMNWLGGNTREGKKSNDNRHNIFLDHWREKLRKKSLWTQSQFMQIIMPAALPCLATPCNQ